FISGSSPNKCDNRRTQPNATCTRNSSLGNCTAQILRKRLCFRLAIIGLHNIVSTSRHRLKQSTAVIVKLSAYYSDHLTIPSCAYLATPIKVLHDILPEPVLMLHQPID